MASLAQLIDWFRASADDRVGQLLFSDPDVTGWLDEAQAEACIRGRLLHEADNPDVCRIAVEAGVASYPLHPALYEIDHLAWRQPGSPRRTPVRLVTQDWLDSRVPEWRDREGDPEYAIQGDVGLRLVPRPVKAGELLLEGYRLPIKPLSEVDGPEIHQAHHRNLVDWALYRGYSRPDTDSMDLERAALHERAFTDYFGLRPDSDLRRTTREDTDHHNKAYP